jgi:hypothetical protein
MCRIANIVVNGALTRWTSKFQWTTRGGSFSESQGQCFSTKARVSLLTSSISLSSMNSPEPRLVEAYPIVSIEDGFAEDDWDGFRAHRASVTTFTSPIRA